MRLQQDCEQLLPHLEPKNAARGGEQGISSARSIAPEEERWCVKYHRPRNRPRALRRSASVRSHRPKKRDECAIRVTTAGGWPEVELKTLRPQSEEQLGSTSAGLKATVEHHRPNATDRDAAKESASAEETPIGRHESRYRLETWTFEGSSEDPGQRGLQVR